MDRDNYMNETGDWVVPYVNGEIIDAGRNEYGRPGLAESGIDPVGAMAILNIGSFRSYSRYITGYNTDTGVMTYEPVPPYPDYMDKHHVYKKFNIPYQQVELGKLLISCILDI